MLRGFNKKTQRELLALSVCGTDCAACPLRGETCAGCNAACGKVFHAPAGKACPIYACCSGKHRFATCAECEELPCGLWLSTRDPSMTDEQFRASVDARVSALKRAKTGGRYIK